jgi:hypothetical protein
MIVEILSWCIMIAAFYFVVALAYRGMDGLAGISVDVESERVSVFTSRASVPG